jgi:hypothetical protein
MLGLGVGIPCGPMPTGPPPLTPAGPFADTGGIWTLTCRELLASREYVTLSETIKETMNAIN